MFFWGLKIYILVCFIKQNVFCISLFPTENLFYPKNHAKLQKSLNDTVY